MNWKGWGRKTPWSPSPNFPGGTGDRQKSRWGKTTVSGRRLKPETSRIQSRNAKRSTATFGTSFFHVTFCESFFLVGQWKKDVNTLLISSMSVFETVKHWNVGRETLQNTCSGSTHGTSVPKGCLPKVYDITCIKKTFITLYVLEKKLCCFLILFLWDASRQRNKWGIQIRVWHHLIIISTATSPCISSRDPEETEGKFI